MAALRWNVFKEPVRFVLVDCGGAGDCGPPSLYGAGFITTGRFAPVVGSKDTTTVAGSRTLGSLEEFWS